MRAFIRIEHHRNRRKRGYFSVVHGFFPKRRTGYDPSPKQEQLARLKTEFEAAKKEHEVELAKTKSSIGTVHKMQLTQKQVEICSRSRGQLRLITLHATCALFSFY